MHYLKPYNIILVLNIVLFLFVLLLGFFQLRNGYANRLNNKACITDDDQRAILLLEQAIRINKENPVYYANLGLVYARMDSAISIYNLYKRNRVSSKYIEKALECFSIAYSLKKNDSLLKLNLFILYALKGDSDEYWEKIGDSLISESIDNEPYNILRINLYEKDDCKDLKKYYIKILSASPGLLETKLFADLTSRDSLLAAEIIEDISIRFEADTLNDVVSMAKLATILRYKGDETNAEVLWKKTTEAMPNLFKPWYNLARFAEEKTDTAQAILFYKKAELLDVMGLESYYSIQRLKNEGNQYASEKIPEAPFAHTEKGLIYHLLYKSYFMKKEIVLNDFDLYNYLK